MNFFKSTIRGRLFLSFSSFGLITIGFVIFAIIILGQIKEANEIRETIDKIENKWSKIHAHTLNYLYKDVSSREYYQSRRSESLWNIRKLQKECNVELSALMNNLFLKQLDIDRYVKKARHALYRHKTYFREIEVKVIKRGYKSYGIEAMVGNQLQELSTILAPKGIDLSKMREAQNSFVFFNDRASSKRVIEESNRLLLEFESKEDPLFIKAKLKLENHVQAFNEYVRLCKEIGLDSRSGLRAALGHETRLMNLNLLKLKVKFNTYHKEREILLIWILIGGASIVLILTIVLSVLISNSISKPIVKLSDRLSQSVVTQLGLDDIELKKNTPEEVEILQDAFNRLLERIRVQLEEINNSNQALEKRNISLEKLNKELDHFIYHTSHDLRSPLVSILGLIEALETNKDEDIDEYLGHMKFCVNRLDTIIIKIIHFYKNKSTELNMEPVNFTQTVQNIFDQNRHLPVRQGVDLIVEDLAQEKELISDDYRLNIVLSNLIINAIKYKDLTKKNQFVRVSRSWRNDMNVIEVRDNGIGISEESKQKVFEMFYRGSEQSEGSGLGLFIVLESIKKINGKLEMESEVGEGTLFTINLQNTI